MSEQVATSPTLVGSDAGGATPRDRLEADAPTVAPDQPHLREPPSRTEYETYFDVRTTGRPPRPLCDRWDRVEVDFCGVVKHLSSWIKESGIKPATVRGRIYEQGLTPVQALTKPDGAGRCLKPLTDEDRDRERKRRQLECSGAVTKYDHRGITHAAGIMAYGRTVFLGTFPTFGDAVLAFNTAVGMLPEEYESTDKMDEKWLVDVTAAAEVARTVKAALNAAGLLTREVDDEAESATA